VSPTPHVQGFRREGWAVDAGRSPSTAWYWGAGVLGLASLITAIALGWGSYQLLQDRLEGLARTAVPGTIVVQVEGEEAVTVFYEDPTADGGFVVQARGTSSPGPTPVDLSVTDPNGRVVATRPYGSDLRFDMRDRVAIASAVFDAPSAGSYTVEVTGDAPVAARVSAGSVVDAGMIARLIGVIALFVGPPIVALVIAVVVAVQRSRTPPQPRPRDETLTPA
jgi:hypothetical protein